MSDLYLTEHGSSVHKYGEALHIKKQDKLLFKIEIKNIDSVQIFANVQISTQVLKKILEHGIELALYKRTELLGQITPPHIKNVEIRYSQYELSHNEKFCLEFGKELLKEKFNSCLDLLTDSRKNNPEIKIEEEIKQLRDTKEKLLLAADTPELLGQEGNFARIYFQAYGKLFKEEGLFNGRSKRPPKDEANACMSFLYTLLTNRLSSWVDGIGFDPYIGFLHKMEYGRVSLGCDLIEPFRAVFCDRLTLRLFNQKILKKGDFERRDNGIYLKRAALKNFLQIYAGEIEKEKSYGFTNGIFLDVLAHLGEWVKESIRTKEVKPLRRKF